jgi:hypothetical protein
MLSEMLIRCTIGYVTELLKILNTLMGNYVSPALSGEVGSRDSSIGIATVMAGVRFPAESSECPLLHRVDPLWDTTSLLPIG